MLAIAPSWELRVERGPDWLWVRIECPESCCVEPPPVADEIWALLERHFVYRLVVELDDVETLDRYLVEQLAVLDERIREHGGLLRLTGVSPPNREILRAQGLDGRFSIYGDLNDAMMGAFPHQPR